MKSILTLAALGFVATLEIGSAMADGPKVLITHWGEDADGIWVAEDLCLPAKAAAAHMGNHNFDKQPNRGEEDVELEAC